MVGIMNTKVTLDRAGRAVLLKTSGTSCTSRGRHSRCYGPGDVVKLCPRRNSSPLQKEAGCLGLQHRQSL
jgi:hypothetical protein